MDDEYNIHDDLERILRDPKAEPCDIPLQYLRDITNNFSDDQKLGEGGFGVVYKGELPNGIMVAVKYLRSVSQCQEKQFKNEIDSLMTVKHKNIVQFVGYCYETQQKYTKFNGRNVFAETAKRLLCFEFMPNGSLDQYISEETCGLDWHKRYKIIKDICCGLHYLHNECQTNSSLIHLDIKPDNVLLGENMVAKIADFGLAKLFDNKKSQTFATSLVGSQGYMAPEYIFEGIISPMADIYSLGVIIIQIITGHSFGPSGIETFSGDFVEPVLKNWRNRLEAAPSCASLETDYQQIDLCLEIGISCIQYDRRKRPTMREIIDMLNKLESTNCYVRDEERSISNQIMPDPKELIEISPVELRFCLELNKRTPCFIKLTNKKKDYVAFHFVDTMAKYSYHIDPTSGCLWPNSTINVVITMEQELPLDMQCYDEFLIQSISVRKYSVTSKPINIDMFNNMPNNRMNKVKLMVVYTPPVQLPSISHTGPEASLQRPKGFPENVDILVMCISQDLGFSNGKPIAACVIYRCLLHWKSFEDRRTVVFDRIYLSMLSEIEAQDNNNKKLAYWLSNSSTLHVLLVRSLKNSGVAEFNPHRRRPSGSFFEGVFTVIQASIQGVRRPLDEAKRPALLFKQQLITHLEKIYGMMRDNLKKDIFPFVSLCIEAPRTKDSLDQQNLVTTWKSIMEVLTKYLNVMKSNYVPSFLIRKIFAQVFSFVNVTLVNRLLLRRECCSFSYGVSMKAGLAVLEQWCIDATGEYAGSSWDELKHARQAVGLLVIFQKSRLTLEEITNQLCPLLSIQQVYRISTLYKDDEHNTQSVSPEVISCMRKMVEEESGNVPSNAFLLDDDSSIQIKADDLSRSMTEFEVTDVHIPPFILENSVFAFLDQRKQ